MDFGIIFTILFIVALFIFSLWIHRKVKTIPVKIISRTIVAIILAIPFYILSILIGFVSVGGGRPGRSLHHYKHFYVTNESSTPLWVSANLSYTPDEVKAFWEQDAEFDVEANFITYQNVYINNAKPNDVYAFEVPRSWDGASIPSQLDIVLKDSSGTILLRLDSNDIDSVMCANMQIVITDSIMQALRSKIALIDGRQEGGVE